MKEFFEEIAKAVSDFKFYQKVKDFTLTKSAKYLLTLVLVITLLLSIRFSLDARKGLDIAVDWAQKNLPTINIQNGIVTVDIKQPYIVSSEDFTMVIDTTGEVASLDGYKRGILLMKDRMLYKESDVKSETYSLSGIESLRIDEAFLKSARKNIIWIIFPIMVLIMYLSFFVARVTQILVFSVISLIAVSMSHVKLEYKQLINIGTYAITPSTLLGAILAFLGLNLPHFWIIYSGLYLIFIVMAILNCRE
ncbi:MAG: DUF1189 domain-containing protein, partial [Candidatus Omnitrophica bacterium]|nr:DUF1189 domain-containing protein [Candidatus Omnitrophota bacterium]